MIVKITTEKKRIKIEMEFDSPIEQLKDRVKEKVGLRPEEQL